MMPERKYVADFTADCVERVSNDAAFIPAKTLYDCFNRYMEKLKLDITPMSAKLFLSLFRTHNDTNNSFCMKGFLSADPEDVVWGFKNLALSPAGKKLMEANK